ncbi:MAG: CHAT domain-containing protein, partial [Cyanobacteria bacterium J06635_1]
VFSSDPSGTYLVAYQDSITANELNTLLQTLGQRDPLELMVLSACATAQGDRRAVLGLAGVAVRAGARSTLSTLWRADDDATTRLMTRFYAALLEPDMTKAKALQQAQLGLLREEGYPAPYFWGTYLLVGNWL